MGKVHSTRKQIVQIADLLRHHLLDASAEPGSYIYGEGWSDDRVAKEAATAENPIQGHHVANVRTEVFGPLYKEPEDDKIASLEKQLRLVRARCQTTEDRLAALQDLHEKLCLTLSINKVLDVRYLKGTPQ